MKRAISFVLCVCLLLSLLAGCEKDEKETESKNLPVSSEKKVVEDEDTDNYIFELKEDGKNKELLVFSADKSKKIMSVDVTWNETFGDELAYTVDLNFDGRKDIIIPYLNPASAVYFKAYIYQPKDKNFVYAPAFEDLPNFALDNETKTVLCGRTASRITTYSMSKYSEKKKDFVITNTIYYEPEENDKDFKFVETKYDQNGEKTGEKTFIVSSINDGLIIDKTSDDIKSYFEPESFWNLDGEKWNSYYHHYLNPID